MESEKEKELWKLARKRAGFKRYLAVYVILMTAFWVFWYFTDHQDENSGLPWPIFPTMAFSIGVMYSFLNAYVFSNYNSVEREYERLKNKK